MHMQKKEYLDKTKEFKEVCYDYKNKMTDEYLREIAHHF